MRKLRPYEERINFVPPTLSDSEQTLSDNLRLELHNIHVGIPTQLLTEHAIVGDSGHVHKFFYANLSEKVGTIWGKTDTRYWYVWYLYELGDYYSSVDFVGKYSTENKALSAMRKSL